MNFCDIYSSSCYKDLLSKEHTDWYKDQRSLYIWNKFQFTLFQLSSFATEYIADTRHPREVGPMCTTIL